MRLSSLKLIRAPGGKAQPPFDIMGNLRIAVCSDPNGAAFDLFEPQNRPGTDVDTSVHGAPSWFETMTTDVPRAAAFNTQLFGWTSSEMPMPGGVYTVFANGAEPVAGMMQIPTEISGMPPNWSTYFTVSDIERAAQDAVKLGATICMEMTHVPGVGRFCGFTSPQGVPFNIIQYER